MLTGLNISLFLQRFFLSLLVFSAMPASVHEAASGTLVMSKQSTGNFVLLARSQGRDYFELLGGTNEVAASLSNTTPSAESDYETALRETVEESRGYFGRRELLLVSDPLKWRIEVDGFVIFRVLTEIFDLKHMMSIKIPEGDKEHWKPMLEVLDYAWVDSDLLLKSEQSMVKDTEGREIKVRENLPTYIKTAIAEGWLD
ncbi:MAG: hypothetical protein ACI9N9_002158 [Enterobacterales bacterium]|jgi:hypothetical protein